MRKFYDEQGTLKEIRVSYFVAIKSPFWDGEPGYDLTFDIDDKEAEPFKGFFPERHSRWYAQHEAEARLCGGDRVELSFHKGNPFGEDFPTGVWW